MVKPWVSNFAPPDWMTGAVGPSFVRPPVTVMKLALSWLALSNVPLKIRLVVPP